MGMYAFGAKEKRYGNGSGQRKRDMVMAVSRGQQLRQCGAYCFWVKEISSRTCAGMLAGCVDDLWQLPKVPLVCAYLHVHEYCTNLELLALNMEACRMFSNYDIHEGVGALR
eukprot:1159978-Pelagomonas_calceolata.AAC.3